MYFFKPISLGSEKKNEFGVNECKFKYEGYISDELCGGAEGEIKGNFVYINKLVFPEDKPDFCEGLLRASLNYGANRGAYMGSCRCENATGVMELMGFEKIENGEYVGDIPTLLAGSCGDCKK